MVTPDEHHAASMEFPGKDPGEVFHSSFRQHWIRMLWPFAKTCLLSFLLLIIGFVTFFTVDIAPQAPRHLILVFLLIFFLTIQFEFLVRIYRYFLYVVVITDRRVHRIKKTLLTMDEHESIDLWALQEINKRQRGPVQTLLGFGSLIIEAQDTHMTLHFVPRVAVHYQEILSLHERARLNRGRMPSESSQP